jgi:hypothetical protein
VIINKENSMQVLDDPPINEVECRKCDKIQQNGGSPSWSMENEHQLLSCLKRLISSWRVSFRLNTATVLFLINNVHCVLLKNTAKMEGQINLGWNITTNLRLGIAHKR